MGPIVCEFIALGLVDTEMIQLSRRLALEACTTECCSAAVTAGCTPDSILLPEFHSEDNAGSLATAQADMLAKSL